MLVPRTGKLGCPFESSRVLGKVQMVCYFAMGRVIDAAPLVVDLYFDMVECMTRSTCSISVITNIGLRRGSSALLVVRFLRLNKTVF